MIWKLCYVRQPLRNDPANVAKFVGFAVFSCYRRYMKIFIYINLYINIIYIYIFNVCIYTYMYIHLHRFASLNQFSWKGHPRKLHQDRAECALRPTPASIENQKQAYVKISANTPPKIKIFPDKWWLEDYFPIQMVPFWVRCKFLGGYPNQFF